MSLDIIELWVRWLGASASLATIAIALVRVFQSLRRPAGRQERSARFAVRSPVLVVKAAICFAAGILLWHPLGIHLGSWQRVVLLAMGSVLLFGGLALYLWGLRSLSRMFGPASAFGVRLHEGHRLVTTGPYRYVRHPMYFGIVSAAIGSLLLYRMWTTLCLAAAVFALMMRARREEKVLAQEFGSQWEVYSSSVPGWLPWSGVKKGHGV